MKKLSAFLIVALLAFGPVTRGAEPEPEPAPPAAPAGKAPSKPNDLLSHMETLADETNRISYAIGVNIARNLKANYTSINPDFLKLGFSDVFDNGRIKMNEDTINASIARYNELAKSHVQEKVEDFKANNLRDAERFLEQNAKKEGVVTLAGGLEYRVISPGKDVKPKAESVMLVQYHGRTLKGVTVDSTLDGSKPGPATIALKDTTTLPFWREVLPLMSLGAKWELYIPPSLAYGETGHGKAAPNELLVYSVEVVGIQ